ncbi:MAG: MFS transporter [Chloroflexi bacterium]|nr:MFS transporter [Chloroflexota bacterium]
MSQPSERPRLNVLSREIFLTLYLPSMALSLGLGIAAPVLPAFAKSFDVSFEVATLVVIVYGIGGLLATFPTGYMIDRVGRRPILLVGPMITAAASFLTASAQSFPELLAWRFLGGSAAQMWQLSRLAMIADTAADRERGRMITWMMQVSRATHLFAPALSGFVAYFWDIRIPFVLHGVLVLLAIIPSLRLAKETDPARREGRREVSQPGDWRYIRSELVRPQMLAFLTAQFLANFTRGLTRGGLLYLYAAYTYGAGTVTLGLMATANSFLGLPIGFATGYVMDRWGRKKTIVPGFSLLSVAMVFMTATALFQLPFELFVASYFAVYLSQSITGGNMQVMGSDLAPRRARGRFMAFWRLIAEAGNELSPPAFAIIGGTLGYAASFGTLSIGALSVALIVGLLIRETVGRERGELEAEPPAPVPDGPPTEAASDSTAVPGGSRGRSSLPPP